ncbi:unnamed protein product [Brassicogethes aeneus]|uniref:alkaline phosphatase n=1 Tax=Brassicogethes aeneus TaxID=1431903 RepID=A0A9P0BGJ9_BRAAE|nr:unnamed protein product [Brassicogethes aeneus]
MLLNLICVFLLCFFIDGVWSQFEGDDFEPYPNNKASHRPTQEIFEEYEIDYWRKNALNAINERLHRKINKNVAKNVILFLGDGMSFPTISAARVFMGGEEKKLAFEKFPHTAISKTYCVDHQTPDSACSATAYLCGVKAKLGTIGVGPAVVKQNCTLMNKKENHVDSIARWFQIKGKKTGLVTTTRVTHASPAAIYAHTAARQWESDTNVLNYKEDPKMCEDIAHQLVHGDTGGNLNVVFGGGRRMFLPKEFTDEEGEAGYRSDRVNLVEEWKNLRKDRGDVCEYVWNSTGLANLADDTEYVLGLFDTNHLPYNLERNKTKTPSLVEMTESAIRLLQKKNKGFFLFVEGGKIDLAHHESWARKALDETLEFSKAIQKAVDITNEKDTLILVTADHAHTMSMSGHAERGSDVFGYAGLGIDAIPYPILNYANGAGYKPYAEDGKRYLPSREELSK